MNCKNSGKLKIFNSNTSVKLCNDNNLQFRDDPLSVLTNQIGTCGSLDGKNFDNENTLAMGSCLCPAVVGDTNSRRKSKFADFNHDSWSGIYSDMDNSTFLLCDSVGRLMGTGTRFTPYLEFHRLANTTDLKAVLSVYKVSDVFGFISGYIFQIGGCSDQYVNGVYHVTWNENLKAHVIQKKTNGS